MRNSRETSHLLTDDEALRLLAVSVGREVDELPIEAAQLLKECGRLPLAVSLVGGMAASGIAWTSLLTAFQSHRLEYLQDEHRPEQHSQLRKAIEVSVLALPPNDQLRLVELAVFHEDEAAPRSAITMLWRHAARLNDLDSELLLVKLQQRSLVQIHEQGRVGVSLHDLIRDYCRRRANVEFGGAAALHDKLLAAYRENCPDSWPSGPNDGYFFTQLRHHLIAAGRAGELADLLQDLRWLEAKNEAELTFDLAADFDAAAEALPGTDLRRRNLRLLAEALLRDIHFIARHAKDYPQALFQSLWNSCWWYDCADAAQHYQPSALGWPPEGPPWDLPEPKLATLMESWRRAKEKGSPGFFWLRSLRPPTFFLRGPLRVAIPLDMDREKCAAVQFAQAGAFLLGLVVPLGKNQARTPSLRVWDSATGRDVGIDRQGPFTFRDPQVSPDGQWRLVVEGGWEEPVRLQDSLTGTEIARFDAHEDVVLTCWAFSSDGKRIVAGGYGEEACGAIFAWDLSSRKRITRIYPSGLQAIDAVWAVAFSDDGERVITGSSDGMVQLWETGTGELLEGSRLHEGGVTAVAIAADGRRIASSSYDGSIRISELDRNVRTETLKEHPDDLDGIVFSSDGLRLVTRSANGTTWLWDAISGTPIACLFSSSYIILTGGNARNSIFVDHRRVISLAPWGMWNAVDGQVIRPADESSSLWWDTTVRFSSDGDRVVLADENGMRIARTEELADARPLAGHSQGVTCMALSQYGRYLATGSDDGTVRLWDTMAGAEIACLRGRKKAEIRSVAFSKNALRVASSAADKTVRVWDTSSMAQIACIDIADPRIWQSAWSRETAERALDAISDVVFTPDGERLVTQSGPGNAISVWKTSSGEHLYTIRGRGSIRSLAAGLAWCALIRGREVEIESTKTNNVVARMPDVPELAYRKPFVPHPSGRTWAKAIQNHLYLFTLEGNEEEPSRELAL